MDVCVCCMDMYVLKGYMCVVQLCMRLCIVWIYVCCTVAYASCLYLCLNVSVAVLCKACV